VTHSETPAYPERSAAPPPRRGARAVVIGGGLAVLVVVSGVYVARNLIAREVLLNWLRERGVHAQADLSGLGLGGVAGRIVAGPPGDPDLSIERAEVAYGLTGFWNRQNLGLEVRSVRLVRPIVKARLKGGRLSFGALDPIVEEFRRRPARPGARQPTIRIDAGRLRLATDYGPADLRADALMDDGKLMRLDARLAPTRLVVKHVAADLDGTVRIRARGEQVDLAVDAVVRRFASPGVTAEGGRVRISGRAPYPDLVARRADGVVSLRLEASAAQLGGTAGRFEDARFDTTLLGRSAGEISRFALSGAGSGQFSARRAVLGGGAAEDLNVRMVAQTFALRPAGDRISADLQLQGTAKAWSQDAFRLRAIRAGFDGAAALRDKAGPLLNGTGAFSADGGIAGLTAAKDEPAEAKAIKHALSNFQVAAPNLRLALNGQDMTLALGAPVRASSPGGGAAALSARGGRPVFSGGRGSFDLAIAGGGLPKADVAVNGLTFAKGAVEAPLRFDVRSNFEPVHDGVVQGSGVLRAAGGAVQITARDCIAVSAARLEFGENDVLGPKGRLCPSGAPLFRYAAGSWRVRGKATGVSAEAPLMLSSVRDGQASVTFGGAKAGLSADANVERARLEDAAPVRRFEPIFLSGPIILREGVWQAAVAGADAAGRRLGEAQVTHDVETGVGEADIETGALVFAEGGLQPAALSPLAVNLASPARGQAGFTGNVAWSPEGVTSRGLLTVQSLDFTSPLGPVTGLKGEIAFTGLAPLSAAPGQRLRADRIAGFAPMSDAEIAFGIADEQVRVEGGEAKVGGGKVELEPFAMPFATGASWSGALRMEGVQISDMVETSPFGDRVDLDARLTGRIPFQVTPQGVRIAAGDLRAVDPGRLSIQRQALADVSASGGAPVAPGVPVSTAPAANAFSDFAYQAMEHLAFDTLTATINSQPGGRLGVLFHIKGRSDPPKKQVLRVGVDELIDRSFMEKPQILPSGTKVDLTLDTSLNLDQLLDDFTGYQKLHSSAEVQAQGVK
jgi:hypothetical protein